MMKLTSVHPRDLRTESLELLLAAFGLGFLAVINFEWFADRVGNEWRGEP